MAPQDDQPRTVRIREARSGVSYSTTVLHESSVMKIELIAYFISRKLSVKIVTHRKKATETDWRDSEERPVYLDREATLELQRRLEELLGAAKTRTGTQGIYLPLSGEAVQFGDQEPAAIAAALARALSRPDILGQLGKVELGEHFTGLFRGAVRLNEMRAAVAELRTHLAQGETDEKKVYQVWCKRHAWAFGNAYIMPDDVREISSGDTLDLLLPSVITGYRDIIELKRPDMRVLVKDEAHGNYYFAANASRAIGQCHRYLDVVHEEAAKGLRDHPEIVAYHPRAIIVIGRSEDWEQDELRALHGLNRRLSGITLMTYDQLLAQGERLIEMLSTADADELGDGNDQPVSCEPPDGPPF